jgi:ATP-binding cassette subfamily D (ALD) protein 3
VAFYNGALWEKLKINKKFLELYNHILYVLNRRFWMGIYDSMLVKYGAFVVGYAILGLPVFGPRKEEYLKSIGSDESKITKDYVRNTSLLINLAKAIGRIVVSYKDVQSLAGYTTLVYEMKEVLDDLETGKYKRTKVANTGEDAKQGEPPQKPVYMDNSLANKGSVTFSDSIIFEDVPILSPNGDVLIQAMNFSIRPGMNLLITGPNGCGKSSLFRILGELWPLFGGKVFKPHIDQIFYIPQRPYLPKGTLRDQIIYPHNTQQMARKRVTDEDLQNLLIESKLEYLVQREGGWETQNDWNDVLSGGEK